jgi:tetratricopeptide (TPR) repeat protein
VHTIHLSFHERLQKRSPIRGATLYSQLRVRTAGGEPRQGNVDHSRHCLESLVLLQTLKWPLVGMEEQMQKIEVAAKKTWPVVMAWIGGITAVIGFCASIAGGITWLRNHHKHGVEYRAKMSLAQTQASQKQYSAALETYQEILKDDPLDPKVLDAQLDTAMLWVENFSLYVREGSDEGDLSSTALDEIFPVLTSGLTRAQGVRSADIEAHLGWAHFLNAKMAQRESDSLALDDFQNALATDPKNAYAHAMLGNCLLQSGGSLEEAVDHFHTAVAAGRALPFVRRLQLGGLLHLEKPGARRETMRVATAMLKNGEQLDPGLRGRMSAWLFDPVVTNHQERVEALSAVTSGDAWKTYVWLTASSEADETGLQTVNQQFIHANLLEVSGHPDAALAEYRELQQKLRDHPGSLRDQVLAAVNRLVRG